MNLSSRFFRQFSAAISIAVPLLVCAQPALPPFPPAFGQGMPPMLPPGEMLPMMPPHAPMFGSLKLTEVQRDLIFKILHQAAPAFHELAKAHRLAQADLQKLALAERDDAVAIKNRAEELARVMADISLLRIKTDRQILATLSAEQRKKLTELPARFGAPD